MLYSVTIEKYQNTQWIAIFYFIYGCIKPVSVPMLTPPTTAETKKKGDMSIRTGQLDNRL